jgi:hypothetical protein
MQIAAQDRVGHKFGRLLIKSLSFRISPNGNKQPLAACLCDCGTEKEILLRSVVYGATTSCGCIHLELCRQKGLNNKTHGLSQTRTFKIWAGMKTRCHNPKSTGYYKYGAKGVTVCEEWRESFETFLNDMGEAPKGMSIDRIDNSKGYSKENCRYATGTEQARNKTINRKIEIDGQTKILIEWVELYEPKYGNHYSRVVQRLHSGWDIISALTRPAKR